MQFLELLKEEFESSAWLTPQFQRFFLTYITEMRRLLTKRYNATEIHFNRGHFDVYGFFKASNGQTYYISTSDVRWATKRLGMFMRTAINDKDYTGGQNRTLPIESEERFIAELDSVLCCTTTLEAK
ncbi:hypothetical protein MUP77_01345 [Candidatus Bathyarchaeota archaeon]|nr:hypothetical protein [Candidatus Bathyarchaeota archaeon]